MHNSSTVDLYPFVLKALFGKFFRPRLNKSENTFNGTGRIYWIYFYREE